MTDDFSARPPRILATELRQARDAQREAEAKETMRDHETAQKAFHKNREPQTPQSAVLGAQSRCKQVIPGG
jgi:hypothetical protein